MEYSTLPQVVDRPHRYEEGLELAPDTGLHAVHDTPDKVSVQPAQPHDGYPQYYPEGDRQGHQGAYSNEGARADHLPGGEGNAKKSSWLRGRRLCLIIGIIAVLVIVGAVLGGVFGSRAARASDDTSASTATTSTSTSSATASATATPSSIVAKSPLSAVSFVTTSDGSPAGPATGAVIVLSFKSPDGGMKASIYATTWGVLSSTSSAWQTTPQVITTSSPAENGTGLAMAGFATSVSQAGSIQYSLQLMVFYVNRTGFINGLKYIDTSASNGIQAEGINEKDYSVRTGSNVAAYWPWIIFQDWSGYVNVVNSRASKPYTNTQLQTVALQGTKLAVVPLSTNYSKIIDGNYGIFYQTADGQIAATIPGKATGGSGNITDSWPSTSSFPTISIADRASFAAFSFARSTDNTSDLVSTFVLYQDETSQIRQVWTDDGQRWKTSSPAVLATADSGTDISCLTPAASNDTYGEPLYVAPQSNLTRCYFQRGGWVAEVQLNGTDWVDLGNVPMP